MIEQSSATESARFNRLGLSLSLSLLTFGAFVKVCLVQRVSRENSLVQQALVMRIINCAPRSRT